MGSYYLNDDYRCAGLKESQNESQNFFNSNQCYAAFKKTLGFGDVGAQYGNSAGEAGEAGAPGGDEWNGARASPVIERLIFQELQSDIVEKAKKLGISIGKLFVTHPKPIFIISNSQT